MTGLQVADFGIDTAEALSHATGVEEVHKIAGEDCFLVKIRAQGTEELATILGIPRSMSSRRSPAFERPLS